MRSDGAVALAGLVVVLIIMAIVSAVFDIGRWIFSDWHWLQIAGPVAIIFALVVACWDLLNAVPDWALKLWGGILVFGPIVFAVLWVGTEGASWTFIADLPVWLTVSVLTALCAPFAVGIWYDAVDRAKESRKNRTRSGLPAAKKHREAFGSAGKTSDDELRDIGMI